jgi:hypothetical protein
MALSAGLNGKDWDWGWGRLRGGGLGLGEVGESTFREKEGQGKRFLGGGGHNSGKTGGA